MPESSCITSTSSASEPKKYQKLKFFGAKLLGQRAFDKCIDRQRLLSQPRTRAWSLHWGLTSGGPLFVPSSPISKVSVIWEAVGWE